MIDVALHRRDGGNSLLPNPSGWTDPATGFDGPMLWERALIQEDARNARYKRTATIVLAEITGFDELRGAFGDAAAGVAFHDACRTIVRQTRTSDVIARIGRLRFALLLIEADEIAAINCVDRVNRAWQRELGTGPGLGLCIGWASPASEQQLDGAQATAMERLEADIHRATASAPPTAPSVMTKNLRRDPWWDLEGRAAATERRRRAIRDRLSFSVALVADLGAFAMWAIHLGLLSFGIRV